MRFKLTGFLRVIGILFPMLLSFYSVASADVAAVVNIVGVSAINNNPFVTGIDSYSADVEKVMFDTFNGRSITNHYRMSFKKSATGPLVRLDMPSDGFKDHTAKSFIATPERTVLMETATGRILINTPQTNQVSITSDEINGPWFGSADLNAMLTNIHYKLVAVGTGNNSKIYSMSQISTANNIVSSNTTVQLEYDNNDNTLLHAESVIAMNNGRSIAVHKYYQYGILNSLPFLTDEYETNDINLPANSSAYGRTYQRIIHTSYRNIGLNGLTEAYFVTND
jgi:hypothetical protein